MVNLEGYEVTHKAFGPGVVIRADEKYVTARFDTKEKTFVYPDVFNGFMIVNDAEVAAAVSADLAAAIAAKIEAEKNRERERELAKRNGIVIPGARIPLERPTDFIVPDDAGDET